MDVLDLKSTQLGLKIYNSLMVLMYLCFGVFFVIIVGISMTVDMTKTEDPIVFYLVMVPALLMFILLFVAFLFGAFTVNKKGKLNWVFQLALVALGFTSVLTILPCIFLFIGLVSEESKKYYLGK